MIERFSGDFLQKLRGFYAVAECGNMSQAADSLGLRQPAVSYLVQTLEAELGVQLFKRGNKSMELTFEGKQLREKTISLFELLTEIRSDIGSEKKEDLKGEISLSTIHSVSVNILPGPLTRFHNRYPKTWFLLKSGGESDFTVEQVASSAIDFGIVAKKEYPAAIEANPLFHSRLVLVSNSERQFSRDKNGYLNNFAELSDAPFVAFSQDSGLYNLIEQEMKTGGARINAVISANNSAVILAYVLAGMGVTILEDFTVEHLRGRLDIYPLPGDNALRAYALITRRRKRLSPQSRACMECLREDFQMTPASPLDCHTSANE